MISELVIDDYLITIIVSKIDTTAFVRLFAGYNRFNVIAPHITFKSRETLCFAVFFYLFMPIVSVPKSIQKFLVYYRFYSVEFSK